jgi:hypothetical protein
VLGTNRGEIAITIWQLENCPWAALPAPSTAPKALARTNARWLRVKIAEPPPGSLVSGGCEVLVAEVAVVEWYWPMRAKLGPPSTRSCPPVIVSVPRPIGVTPVGAIA